jgi:hypothetical protein
MLLSFLKKEKNKKWRGGVVKEILRGDRKILLSRKFPGCAPSYFR